MKIKPIKTEQDYEEALQLASHYFKNEPSLGSEDGDIFEVLLTLIDSYEKSHFPIDSPDAVEAIKFRLEQSGLNYKDLIPSIGRINRVYEVMSGKRPLSLLMIRKIHDEFNIPAEVLIRQNSKRASDERATSKYYVSSPNVSRTPKYANV